jgi:hypothetical protein
VLVSARGGGGKCCCMDAMERKCLQNLMLMVDGRTMHRLDDGDGL